MKERENTLMTSLENTDAVLYTTYFLQVLVIYLYIYIKPVSYEFLYENWKKNEKKKITKYIKNKKN